MQKQELICQDVLNNKVDDSFCSSLEKPPPEREERNCPTCQWETRKWGPCSEKCEIGTQSRQAVCMQHTCKKEDGRETCKLKEVNDHECWRLYHTGLKEFETMKKPDLSQPCNVDEHGNLDLTHLPDDSECHRDCIWGPWRDGYCTINPKTRLQCGKGKGIMVSTRNSRQEKSGKGVDCVGPDTKTEPCDLAECYGDTNKLKPIDCVLTNFKIPEQKDDDGNCVKGTYQDQFVMEAPLNGGTPCESLCISPGVWDETLNRCRFTC